MTLLHQVKNTLHYTAAITGGDDMQGSECFVCGARAGYKALHAKSKKIVPVCKDHQYVRAESQLVYFVRSHGGNPVALFDGFRKVEPAFPLRRGPQPRIGEVWEVAVIDHPKRDGMYLLRMIRRVATADQIVVQSADGYVPNLPKEIFGAPLLSLKVKRTQDSWARIYKVDDPRSAIAEYAQSVVDWGLGDENVINDAYSILIRMPSTLRRTPSMDSDGLEKLIKPYEIRIHNEIFYRRAQNAVARGGDGPEWVRHLIKAAKHEGNRALVEKLSALLEGAGYHKEDRK